MTQTHLLYRSVCGAVCLSVCLSVCVCVQLCKAGLKTLQDLGPEMRLALNEDLEEDEEEVMMEEEEELEENYKVTVSCGLLLVVGGNVSRTIDD